MMTNQKYRSKRIQEILDSIPAMEMAQMENRMQISLRIEVLLEEQGWSKKKFSTIVGKQPSVITKWLSGTHNFTIDVLTEVSRAFGISLYALIRKQETLPLIIQLSASSNTRQTTNVSEESQNYSSKLHTPFLFAMKSNQTMSQTIN